MKRLRIHGSASMAGRFFVQFVALIYMSSLRREMRKANLIERFTVRELLEEMEPLTRVDYSGKYEHLITEVSKTQRQILEGFGVASPT
jgi:transposase